jgi:enoyl-CoA hydratase
LTDSYQTLMLAMPEPHVCLVTLNRPEVSNAFNTAMARDLMNLFETFLLDFQDIRCIVLTGSGPKAFCAGGDLKERNGMSNEAWSAQHLVFERMIRAVIACPVPIIGAVNGAAFGGGVEIAGACDFIYAAEHARFALTEVTLGIMPGAGGTQTLPRAIGERRAKELLLTGRAFSAAEALEWGFVNRILPAADLIGEAIKAAAMIACNAPISTRQIKQAVHRGLQMSLEDGLAFEIEAYNRTVPTEDRQEGIRAFNEKRQPQFKGR